MPKLLEEASDGWKRFAAVAAGVATISALVVSMTGWDAPVVTLIVAVLGILVLAFGYMGDKIVARVDNRIDDVEEKLEAQTTEIRRQNHEQDLSLKRLELLNLIAHTPENKVEIERVAKHYFVTLKGDWYATKVYSKWAEEHGGDISFVISE